MTDITASAVRILIVDGEPAVHAASRRAFERDDAGAAALDFAATCHARGLDAVAEVERSIVDGEGFAVAFIDARLPGDIDGGETARRIRAIDADIQLVIVSGDGDFCPAAISRVTGPPERIFYLAKPFTDAEARQTAIALSHRWRIDREQAALRAALLAQVVQLEEQAIELAANESKAIHMAHHDVLTDAPNRLAFLRALTDQVGAPGSFAMAMIDLDRFKLINDTLGHLAGDELIRMICAILTEQVADDGFVARLGGDEFGVLLRVRDEAEAVARCERLVRACSASFSVFGHSVQGAASVGVVIVDGDQGREPVDVMRRADLALNEAKRSGRGKVRVFDDSMDESIRFRRRIEAGLAGAIANGELSLVYQPVVARDTLDVIAFEALLRWDSPVYGSIGPTMFIPIAEESNLIHELGDWVIDHALAMLPEWPGQYVSINVSPRQFRRQNFVGHVTEKLRRAGQPPNRLQIEITEIAISGNAERAADTLHRLRQMGCRIALDDFGTGYSSLYNIRKFALDCLKIDHSFIDGMRRERESAAIVRSIIHLGRALGLEVVAEGVESDAQVQALRVAGCSHLQGDHLSPPVDGADAIDIAHHGLPQLRLARTGTGGG